MGKGWAMKIEFTTTAYVSDDYRMGILAQGVGEKDDQLIGSALSFSQHDMRSCWLKVGTASISVELVNAKEIHNEQLALLHAQLQKERADSQVRQNAILDQISKLQALEWEGAQA